MRRRSATLRNALLGVLVLAALLAALVVWLNLRGEDALDAAKSLTLKVDGEQRTHDAATIARGAYLARAGNCIGCHTARGGANYAGGRGIDTPFGTVYAPNITPDADTGIGCWSSADFWRALHNGRSRDGRLLVPAFPYPSYTQVTREDSDAIHAYLASLPAVRQPNRAHALRFPYNLQAALAVWRAIFFKPGVYAPQATQSAEWNRGGYLVRGLGHCAACHSERNALGATATGIELGGGLIPMQNWYAPSLASSRQAGVADWDTTDVVALLKTGISPQASVMGPMAEVVFRSTQYLTDADLRAMAVFLKALPQTNEAAHGAKPAAAPANADMLQDGGRLYGTQCAACHGAQGQGVASIYPALAGNRAVQLDAPNNVIKAILHGGFAPATAANPRPFGMPPLGQVLTDAQVAAVATYVRQSWGNAAPAVSALDVLRAR